MSRRLSKLIQQAQDILKHQKGTELTEKQKELCNKLGQLWLLQNLVICGEEHNLSDDDISRLDELEQELLLQMNMEV
ncbi:hypothetical protein [Ureibacillus thermosphaericus]|uniref:Uncharacterized protein YeaC (DUF1315 family) n=1 Tax=Ureibacillus thermosphaericus TaxID=51173 RepID=A0A840PWB6_URETH|nr:hypothetical protein [Ureibacillus thermosphaericus]MBB5150277.1 uncharacterized protein YeaC (DUF1315 family) [Ureibacillus thermosphaericus]NKZ32888.1 hypothetical protein [Ureibacillus thermosphaericus]